MTVGFNRSEMTITNKLHGDKVVKCYVKNGIAVAKLHARWGVYHAAQGMKIFSGLDRKTFKEAKEVAERVLSLPVDWQADPESVKFVSQLRDAADHIRQIADTR